MPDRTAPRLLGPATGQTIMDWLELSLTAARGLLVYAVMLVVIRLLGKRTVGNFTAFDLLVALMLGEVVDEIIYGEVSIAEGMMAIVVVALAKYATAWIACRSHRLSALLEGTPTELVREGELVQSGLRKELMGEQEVMAALRLQGVAELSEVKSARMEVDGEVSVLLAEWAEPLRKGDAGLEARPHGSKRTDSPEALGQV